MIGARRVVGWANRMRGQRRRARGLYDEATNELLRRAVERSPTPQNWLALAQFQRELGELPQGRVAQALVGALGDFAGSSLKHACNLLIECGSSDEVRTRVSAQALRAMSTTSPPIADLLHPDLSSERARRLARFHRSQSSWRQELAELLRDRRGSLCVVGNAGSLLGSGLGARIDGHDLVTRFNRFRSDATAPVDVGSRIDIWVRICDLNDFEVGGAHPIEWVVLSGPDRRFRLFTWDEFDAMLADGARVVTVPLPVWRSLVARLHAPPSAGILYLAWVIELLGGAEGLTVAGFQRPDAGAPDHDRHIEPGHRPSRRHAWDGERRLLAEWQDQGLSFLP